TAGIGTELNRGKFRIAPVIRYTRWKSDARFPLYPTNPDQVELLTTISYGTDEYSRTFGGHKIWLGLLAGAGLTDGFHPGEFAYKQEESQRFIGGLSVGTTLTRGLDLEVNGLYRPLHAVTHFPSPDGSDFKNPFTVLTWEFPVLAKYRWKRAKW